jgi:hypothetical protein
MHLIMGLIFGAAGIIAVAIFVGAVIKLYSTADESETPSEKNDCGHSCGCHDE